MRYSVTLCAVLSALVLSALSAGRPPALRGQAPPAPAGTAAPAYCAARAATPVRVDGRLDDAAWAAARVATSFRTVEPTEGRPSAFDTRVRVLYDERALYVGVDARDPLGARGVRVQDLRRKFDYFQNDLFGVSFDALHDGRTVAAFQVTPYGAQRDLQVFDDLFYNREWEGVWRARAVVTDSGWTAELAIPWGTLRYAADGAPWRVNFYRVARRANETSAWAPWPRAYTAHRVPYFGTLTGLEPPAPRRGGGVGGLAGRVRLRPYLLGQERSGGGAAGNGAAGATAAGGSLRAGGELTWTPTPNAVVDLTANTDFAQAEVDRQVVNTSRFSVFFPERRQFFLEGGTLFDVGPDASYKSIALKPFFSRRVGLDEAGGVVPIRGGARYVRRDAGGGDGLLVMRQGASPGAPSGAAGQGATTFGVARASRNVGAAGRLGVLAAGRAVDGVSGAAGGAGAGARGTRDATLALDAFTRAGPSLALSGLVSTTTAYGGGGAGVAAYAQADYDSRTLDGSVDASLVTRDYRPSTGFVARSDVLRTAGYVAYEARPAWRPRSLRYFYPYLGTALYTGASDRRLQETFTEAYVDLFFNNGALVYPDVQHSYQRLAAPFSPVRGVTVAPGTYSALRSVLYGRSNQSARVGGTALVSTGGYFDRRLDAASLTARVVPTPRAAALLTYEVNRFRGAPRDSAGRAAPNVTTHLVAPELRLALNPRVQLTSFYQYNTAAARGALNARFSWEFAPLSYVYFVANDLRAVGPDARAAGPARPAQQLVVKVVWLRPL
jgi:hypothetical protein